ncbi:MAG: hypothetical protein M1546_00330 [Chloroflexi bacterium]|nr:hypothetical protein [Chloroflexota bacterium]
MTIRAKFKVVAVTTRIGYSNVELMPMYDTTLPEDQRFHSATPSGKIEMVVNNPIVIKAMTVGRDFYVDFTPVGSDGQDTQ